MSTQEPLTGKREEPPERKPTATDFYVDNDFAVTSAEEVLSEYREHDHRTSLRSTVLEAVRPLFQKIDVERVRLLSSRLVEVSEELEKLRKMIGIDEAKAQRYSTAIDELIGTGIEDLEFLVKELSESGLLQYFEHLSRTGVLRTLKIGYEDLLVSEHELLGRFGFSAEETELLWRVVKALLHGKITRIPDEQEFYMDGLIATALKQSIEFIKWYLQEEQNKDSHAKRRVLILNGVGQIFFGMALIGLNVAGYMATAGLLLTIENTLMSAITGGAVVLGGAKDVDLAKFPE